MDEVDGRFTGIDEDDGRFTGIDEDGGRFTGIDEDGGRFTGIGGMESEVVGIDRLLDVVAGFVADVATRVPQREDRWRVTISELNRDGMIRNKQSIDQKVSNAEEDRLIGVYECGNEDRELSLSSAL